MTVTVTTAPGAPLDLLGFSTFEDLSSGSLSGETATGFTFTSADGLESLVVAGSGLTYDGQGAPTGGTVSSITYDSHDYGLAGGAQVTLAGLSLSVAAVAGEVAQAESGHGYAALAALLSAALTSAQETGSSGDDSLAGLGGGDTLVGGAGDDLLLGDRSPAITELPDVSGPFVGDFIDGGAKIVLPVAGSVSSFHIYDVATGTEQPLSVAPAAALYNQYTSANISPDVYVYGSPADDKFAYWVYTYNDQSSHLFVVDAGSGQTTTIDGDSYNPIFSHDGKQLVYTHYTADGAGGSSTYQIDVRNLTTGATQAVSANAAGQVGDRDSDWAVFSPDGTKVAFESSADNLVSGDTNGAEDVFVKDLETGAVTRVSTAADGSQLAFGGYEPAFSPDGTKIAFATLNPSLTGLYGAVYEIDEKSLTTGAVTQLSPDIYVSEYATDPIYSPDGTKLAYYHGSDAPNGGGSFEIVDLATGAVSTVVDDAFGLPIAGTIDSLVFSPDGRDLIVSTYTDTLSGGLSSEHTYLLPLSAFGGPDVLDGGAGDDTLYGGSGADTILASAGQDSADGGSGLDTIVFASPSRDYAVHMPFDAGKVSGGVEGGQDTLSSIETVQFADGVLTFDPDSAAAQVYRLYETALGRAPDFYGEAAWTNQLEHGLTLQQLADLFTSGSEFQARYAGTSNEQFVEDVYRDALHREGDTGGVQAWTQQLDSGALTRSQLIVVFSEGEEQRGLTADAMDHGIWVPDPVDLDVEFVYQAAFGRPSDDGGLQHWAGEIEAGRLDFHDLVVTATQSDEFLHAMAGLDHQQEVEQLYETALGRAADPGGLAFWTAQLDAGHSIADLVQLFAQGSELAALVEPRLAHADWFAS